VAHLTPPGPDPLPPVQGARHPTRSAAAHRRAMQAAIANTVRAMRSTTGGRRSAMPGAGRTPPSAGL
jgi:hypothetical protein